MKSITALLFGILSGPALLSVCAAVWGGLVRAAPCHEAPNFMAGAYFAAVVLTEEFWLPAAFGGTVVGIIVNRVWRRRTGTG